MKESKVLEKPKNRCLIGQFWNDRTRMIIASKQNEQKIHLFIYLSTSRTYRVFFIVCLGRIIAYIYSRAYETNTM